MECGSVRRYLDDKVGRKKKEEVFVEENHLRPDLAPDIHIRLCTQMHTAVTFPIYLYIYATMHIGAKLLCVMQCNSGIIARKLYNR